MGTSFSPMILENFSLQMKQALKLAENVPDYVMRDAEAFRQSIRRWADELRAADKKVANG